MFKFSLRSFFCLSPSFSQILFAKSFFSSFKSISKKSSRIKSTFATMGALKFRSAICFVNFFCKGSEFWSSIFSNLFSGRVQFWANNCKCNSIFCLLTGLVQIFPTSAALTVTQTPIGQTLSICDDQTMLPEVLLNWNGGCLGVRCSAGETKIY